MTDMIQSRDRWNRNFNLRLLRWVYNLTKLGVLISIATEVGRTWMVSTHWIFICPATHNNSTIKLFIASPINNKMFFVELPILIADFWPIKVNFPLTHTVAQLRKMCLGIPYMAGNQYSSLAWLLVTMQLIEREASHRFSNTHWGGHLMSGNHP